MYFSCDTNFKKNSYPAAHYTKYEFSEKDVADSKSHGSIMTVSSLTLPVLAHKYSWSHVKQFIYHLKKDHSSFIIMRLHPYTNWLEGAVDPGEVYFFFDVQNSS